MNFLTLLLAFNSLNFQIMGPIMAGRLTAGAAPAVTKVNTVSSGGFAVSTTLASSTTMTVTAGNAIVCGVRYSGSGGTGSFADTIGNTYSLAHAYNPSGSNWEEVWYSANVTGGSGNTITATTSGGPGFYAFGCVQFANVKLASPFDTSVLGTIGGNGSVTTGSFTTTFSRELLFAVLDSGDTSNSWTPGACGTGTGALAIDGTASGVGVALNIMWAYVSTTQTSQTCTASAPSGGNATVSLATFKAQ